MNYNLKEISDKFKFIEEAISKGLNTCKKQLSNESKHHILNQMAKMINEQLDLIENTAKTQKSILKF